MMLKMEAMEIQTGDEFDDDNESSCSSLRRRGCVLLAILTTVVTMSIGYILSTRNSVAHVADETDELIQLLSENIYSKLLPDELFEQRIYNNSDFVNKLGVTPAFWGQNETCDDLGNNCAKVWGPCYAKNNPHWKNKTQYLPISKSAAQYSINMDNLSGYCRPGFLIIGQGKCGTSSLYHYLVGHPRVLPANEKQIHYFKYYTNYPMKWYLGHYPTAESFLGQGALMTGEASPGYLPYPDVVALIRQEMAGTKIICVGRDPLERSYSSYRYNYVNPAIVKLRKGARRDIKRDQPESYYNQYLFSFEEMMKAELEVIQKCLQPGGIGITGAEKQWKKEKWGEKVYAARNASGEPPLVDIDGMCYGNPLSVACPRKQWLGLNAKYPEKYLDVPNVHLSQAIIGRSLYVYPLEWWYAMFPEKDLYFLCTEEMKDFSGQSLNQLGQFLGLPSHNFSSVISEGMYNVGEHQGYDKVTSWDTVEDEAMHHAEELNLTAEEIPLSAEFRKVMVDFFRPHNERLFKLVGRRCKWD